MIFTYSPFIWLAKPGGGGDAPVCSTRTPQKKHVFNPLQDSSSFPLCPSLDEYLISSWTRTRLDPQYLLSPHVFLPSPFLPGPPIPLSFSLLHTHTHTSTNFFFPNHHHSGRTSPAKLATRTPPRPGRSTASRPRGSAGATAAAAARPPRPGVAVVVATSRRAPRPPRCKRRRPARSAAPRSVVMELSVVSATRSTRMPTS